MAALGGERGGGVTLLARQRCGAVWNSLHVEDGASKQVAVGPCGRGEGPRVRRGHLDEKDEGLQSQLRVDKVVRIRVVLSCIA